MSARGNVLCEYRSSLQAPLGTIPLFPLGTSSSLAGFRIGSRLLRSSSYSPRTRRHSLVGR